MMLPLASAGARVNYVTDRCDQQSCFLGLLLFPTGMIDMDWEMWARTSSVQRTQQREKLQIAVITID